jgi:hypothetical protein
MSRLLRFVCYCMVFWTTAFLFGCGSSEKQETTKESMQVLRSLPGPDRFQVVSIPGYINGWDTVTYPTMYALVTSAQQYDSIVSSGPYDVPPDPQIYSSHDLIIVSKVMHAPLTDWGAAFDVDSVSENGDVLTVNYHFHPPAQYSTWDASLSFAILFPKKSYSKILMVENDVQVRELNPVEGQWCIPPR